MINVVVVLAMSFLNFFLCLNATELTISQAGIYQLGAPILTSPTTADNIINITASDVVLDLGGYVISQANGTANVAGIVVNQNLSDIVIRNGTIRSVTGTGISLLATDSRIRISNILFENCAGAGMAADGSAGTITDLELTQCRFYGCSSTGTSVILWNNVSRSSIVNCIIDGTINTAAAFTCINLLTCTSCTMNDITIQNNTTLNNSALFSAINENSTFYNYFSNVIIRNNTSGASANFNGFNTTGTSSLYLNCSIVGNFGGGANNAFNLNSTTGNLYRQCQIINNTAQSGTLSGFRESSPGNQNIFTDCTANVGSSSSTGVFFNLNSLGSIVARCTASNILVGIGLSVPSTVQKLTVFDCLFSKLGTGVQDAVSTTGDLYYRNVAFNNSAAQFSGVGFSATTPGAPATQNIAAVTQPWTNLAIAA
ncbi:hypothetical protein HYX58_00135 [Candidatus Dependentiae bacterium]|nr:hypothetical protein [Candidatus Dependentiae bacterium]